MDMCGAFMACPGRQDTWHRLMHIYGKTCYILPTAHWGRRKAKGKTKLQLAAQIFKWPAPQVVLLSIVFQCPYDFPLYIRIYILYYKIIYVFCRIERGVGVAVIVKVQLQLSNAFWERKKIGYSTAFGTVSAPLSLFLSPFSLSLPLCISRSYHLKE